MSDIFRRTFAANLRALINERGWSVKEAAKQTGLKYEWWRKAVSEAGVRYPKEYQMKALVGVFGNVDWTRMPVTDDSRDVVMYRELALRFPPIRWFIEHLHGQLVQDRQKRLSELRKILQLDEKDLSRLHEIADLYEDDRKAIFEFFTEKIKESPHLKAYTMPD